MATTKMVLTQRPAWKALQAHYRDIRGHHLRKWFADDPTRGERLTRGLVVQEAYDCFSEPLGSIRNQRGIFVYYVKSFASDRCRHCGAPHRHSLEYLHSRAPADAQRDDKDLGSGKVSPHVGNVAGHDYLL